VGIKNLAEYIHPAVWAIGGGWLCDKAVIDAGDYAAVTEACAKSVEIKPQEVKSTGKECE